MKQRKLNNNEMKTKVDRDLSFESLTSLLVLNSPTVQLRISKFELRLLNFFNCYCIPSFSCNVNLQVDRVWRYQVPSLFLQSDLVKNCVYSFSAVRMSYLCDLDYIKNCDNDGYWNEDSIRHNKGAFCDIFDLNVNFVDAKNILYIRTLEYFMESLKEQNRSISDEVHKNQIVDPSKAAELVISGILIFAFLGIQPHKLLPLVSFDSHVPDMISICQGIRAIIILSYDTLKQTNYKYLFIQDEDDSPKDIKRAKFPVIIKLREQLSEYFESISIINSILSNEFEILSDAIELLNISIYRVPKWRYPVPLYLWSLLIGNEFHNLIKSKNVFALRILFIYSSLCLISMQLMDKPNVWTDYLKWFKDFNMEVFGKWNYEYDMKLYYLMVENNYILRIKNGCPVISTFDPESMYDKI